jgi:hypothetical protein
MAATQRRAVAAAIEAATLIVASDTDMWTGTESIEISKLVMQRCRQGISRGESPAREAAGTTALRILMRKVGTQISERRQQVAAVATGLLLLAIACQRASSEIP